VLQVVHRVITRHLLGQAGIKAEEADSGAVTLIQRFGSAANLNMHLHCLVLERFQTNAAGQVVLKLKTAWRDGTTHLVMSPLEFMQRLAALVPRPRLHLIRFHGVLAPNAKLRALVVPQEVSQVPETPAQQAKPAACEANCGKILTHLGLQARAPPRAPARRQALQGA
jgi:hypothetical protein